MRYQIGIKGRPDKKVTFDKETFEWISKNLLYIEVALLENLKIHSSGVVYFQRYIDGEQITIYLHTIIAKKFLTSEANNYQCISFKNRNKLDLRIENMKYISGRERNMKQKVREDSGTRYKGVSKDRERFRARVKLPDGQIKNLGSFGTPEEAADAYNKAVGWEANKLPKKAMVVTKRK